MKGCKYLGQTMAIWNRMIGEIQARIRNGWKTYWKHKHIFRSKMSIRAKTKILKSSILPVLSYGAQTWAFTKRQTNKLIQTQNSTLRHILGIRLKDKIKNEEIYRRTNSAKISYIIKKLKINYARHLARENKGKWNCLNFLDTKGQKKKEKRISH